MNRKNFLTLSLILIIAYIAYLKLIGLADINMNDLLNSIRPYLLHSLFLMGAFIFNLVALLKNKRGAIIGSALLCLLASLTFLPMGLMMLIPALVLTYTFIKLN